MVTLTPRRRGTAKRRLIAPFCLSTGTYLHYVIITDIITM